MGAEPVEDDPATRRAVRRPQVAGRRAENRFLETGDPGDGVAQRRLRTIAVTTRASIPPPIAIPDTAVQERPTHEAIAAADQLRDLDFIPTVLDIQAESYCRRSHENADGEQSAREQDAASNGIEDGGQPLDPSGVQLHDVDRRQLPPQIGREARQVFGRGGTWARPAQRHERNAAADFRSGASIAAPKTGLVAKALECLVSRDEIHFGDIASLAQSIPRPARFVTRGGPLQDTPRH